MFKLNSIKNIINKDKLKMILVPGLPGLIMLAFVIIAIFAPLLMPHNPLRGNIANQFIPPSWMPGGSSKYVLGTDYYGRDILSRLIYGTQTSLIVVAASIMISAFVGMTVGLISGYVGGIVDDIVMRIVDAFISIPYLVVAIVLAAAFGSGILNVILIISLFQWSIYARQIRAETLAIKEQDYVAVARISGASTKRIIIRHFIPNIVPTILVLLTLHIGELILWEATLSFLGVGIPQPIPSWGSMISDGEMYITTRWWLSFLPGLVIVIAVVSANILGDWLRDSLDPRLRQM